MFCHHFNPDLCSTALHEQGSRSTSLSLANPLNYRRTTVPWRAACPWLRTGDCRLSPPSFSAQAQWSAVAVRSNQELTMADSSLVTLHWTTFTPQLAAQEAKEWQFQNDWNNSTGDILRCISLHPGVENLMDSQWLSWKTLAVTPLPSHI